MLKRDLNNAVVDILGEALWGFQTGMIASATVLVVILRHFRAGPTMIGSITTVEICAMLFPQIVGLYIFKSTAQRKRDLIVFHYTAVIPVIFLLGVVLYVSPHLNPKVVRNTLLCCWGLLFLSNGFLSAVWMDWLASLFELRIRGTVMGLSFCASAALGVTGGLISAWVLSQADPARYYAWLYFTAAAIAVVSISTFWFIDDPVRLERADSPPSLVSILGKFGESLSDRDFRAFLVGRILAVSGFCILPLIANYFASASGGSIAPGALVRCGTSIAFGTAVAQLGLGRLGDRFGHRLGLIIGAGAQIGALVLLLTVHGELGCLLVYFAAGICSGSAFLSHYNMVFETCPHENRGAHIILANLVIGGCTALTPVCAGLVASRWGSRIVFEMSLALSLVAFAWFLFRVRDPREKKVC